MSPTAHAGYCKSQIFQDRWVLQVLSSKRNGYFLEIGAHDGLKWSNTYVLEKSFNWSGLLIEADPRYFAQISKHRSSRAIHACLDSKQGRVQFVLPTDQDGLGGIAAEDTDLRKEKLDARMSAGKVAEVIEMETIPLYDVLVDNSAPRYIDYMSIDIEGAEHRVLYDFPFEKYEFGVITIERPKAALIKRLEDSGYIVVWEHKMDKFVVNSKYFDVSLARSLSQRFFSALPNFI